MRFENIQRDQTNTEFAARVTHNGEFVATAKKRRGAKDYEAHRNGILIATGRTQEELLQDLRDVLGLLERIKDTY